MLVCCEKINILPYSGPAVNTNIGKVFDCLHFVVVDEDVYQNVRSFLTPAVTLVMEVQQTANHRKSNLNITW